MENTRPLNPIQARIQAQRAAQRGAPSTTTSARIPQFSLRGPTPRGPDVTLLSAPSGGASFPAVNSAQRAGARHKVALEPGCSPLDWAALNSSGKNLKGIDPREFPMRVTKEALKQHNTKEDCWTVLKGKVYNLTPYVRFHPGGVEEILKCAGKDGTLLFMKYHSWVNYERMLDNCWVGFYMG